MQRALTIAIVIVLLALPAASAMMMMPNPYLADSSLLPQAQPRVGHPTLYTTLTTSANTVDTQSSLSIANNVTKVKNVVLADALATRDRLTAAATNSDFVLAAVNSANLTGSPIAHGIRTNQSLISGSGLGQATLVLYRELGIPLGTSDTIATLNAAAMVPSAAQQAGATAIYAYIDALHYRNAAFANVDNANLSVLVGNESTLLRVHDRLGYSSDGTNITLQLSPEDTRVVDAAANVTNKLNTSLLAQGADVLAQAIDAIGSINFPAEMHGNPTGTLEPTCAAGVLVFASPD